MEVTYWRNVWSNCRWTPNQALRDEFMAASLVMDLAAGRQLEFKALFLLFRLTYHACITITVMPA